MVLALTKRVTVTGPEGRDAGFQGRSVLGAEGAGEGEDSPLGRALTGGESVLQDRVAAVTPAAAHPPLVALHSGFLAAVGARSAITVPLGARDRITGALTVEQEQLLERSQRGAHRPGASLRRGRPGGSE